MQLDNFLIYINRLYILTQPKEGKHCQPSLTSFGLVDRFKGNYSAMGRGNSSSGRGKSITPFDYHLLVICSHAEICRMCYTINHNRRFNSQM